jgi:hypothetical protein
MCVGSSLKFKGSGSEYERLTPLCKLEPYVPVWITLPLGPLATLLSPLLVVQQLVKKCSDVECREDGVVILMKLFNFQQQTLNRILSGFSSNQVPINFNSRKLFKVAFHSIPLKLLFHLSTAILNPDGR